MADTSPSSPEKTHINKDRMRETGGNRFIESDATSADLLKSINDQLGDLRDWAAETGRIFDVAEVTISTRRIASGRISVSVTADLAIPPTGPSRQYAEDACRSCSGKHPLDGCADVGCVHNCEAEVRCSPASTGAEEA